MRKRWLLIAASTVAACQFASGQTAAEPTSPKFQEDFNFSLSAYRYNAVNVLAKSMAEHEELFRGKELETSNAPVLTKVLDLLRYVPIHLSASDGDDFFTPSYLRSDYVRVPLESRIIDTR